MPVLPPLASPEEAELKVYDNLVVAFDQINKRQLHMTAFGD